MIARLWGTLTGRMLKPAVFPSRKKLFFDEMPDVIYAVGDIHGCYDLFHKLQNRIVADASRYTGRKWLVTLGDYVDRGPKSAAVIDALVAKTTDNMERFCLSGNHEEAMLDFLINPSLQHRWLGFGGVETLYSYGIYTLPDNREKLRHLIDSHIPQEHFAFLASLPSLLSVPGYCFVHAGIENGIPLSDQNDAQLLWSRPDQQLVPASVNRFLTIHGHTPIKAVERSGNRINVDTGAYMSGILSAVKISRQGEIAVIHAD
jgi:serine/threonine protein phosphatase 1